MTKVYVMMAGDEPKYANLSREAIEKCILHQERVWIFQRQRNPFLPPAPRVWIKEVGEEDSVDSEVVS